MFAIETDPTLEEIQYLEDRLYEYNIQKTGFADGENLAIFVRDEAGQIVAGIAGYTWGGFCEMKQFWIEESRRGQGLGSQLLAAVEAEARRRGCTQIILASLSFQAPGFYVKHGFEVLFAVADQPRGHQQVHLRKVLT
jgi:GNAT superfamily N-acetyltransferase